MIEAAGPHWVLAMIGSVRAVCDACMLRKDWDRISRGLSDLAIHRGWWPEDGSKIDFAGAMGQPGTDLAKGHAPLGAGDDGTGAAQRRHRRPLPAAAAARAVRTGASLGRTGQRGGNHQQPDGSAGADQGQLAGGVVPHFGPPAASVFLPVVPVADLPAAYSNGAGDSPLGRFLAEWREAGRRDGRLRATLHSALAELQQQLDEWMREFVQEAGPLHRRGEKDALHRTAASFLQHCHEHHEELADSPKPSRRCGVLQCARWNWRPPGRSFSHGREG